MDLPVTVGQQSTARYVATSMLVVAIAASMLGRWAASAHTGVLAAIMGAVIITELLSAALLFNQFVESRAAWLAAVATGYTFVGFCVVGYLLTFPGVFSAGGFFGASLPTALLVWCIWHAGFPLAALAGVWLRRARRRVAISTSRVVAWCVGASAVASAAALYFCIHAAPVLPDLLDAHGFTPLMTRGVLPAICILDALAAVAIVQTSSPSTAELWLPVALIASMLDAIMGVIAPRYAVVWYVGKFFALASSTTIVSVYLVEIAAVSRALTHANAKLRSLSEHLARYDPVTELPNRSVLQEHVRDRLDHAKRGEGRIAVLHVSLDHFSTISEAMGMSAADDLLRESAHRLASLRGEHLVACTGGGDFVVVLASAGTSEITATADDILRAMRQSFVAGGHRIFPSGSLGVAVAPDDGADPESILGAAAAAMEIAKQDGGNQVRFYRSSMRKASVERIALEAELRSALRSSELVVHYQPIVDVGTRKIAGVEALVRWMHPQRGLVGPDAFIPSAEQNGLIVPIGKFVLRTALRQMRSWISRGVRLPVSVNVSVREFRDPGFFDHLCGALAAERVPPELLCIEVTETLAIDDAEQTRQTLSACRDLGLRISLDDFGTSHACLANVKRLPITSLKIDKLFVRDLVSSRTDAAIATAILSFAKSLQLVTVAEGVETPEQLQWLRSAGCAYAQGFLFSKAVPAEAIELQLRDQRLRTA
jgi:diguanylate cyclase (GGDEF)-like protein